MLDESLASVLDLRGLGGALQKIRQKVRSGVNTAVFTSNIAERIHITWGLDTPTLFVVSDRVKAREYYEQFKAFDENVVLLIERDDMLMYRKLAVGADVTARLRALNNFVSGKSHIMIATSEALLQNFPTKENISKSMLTLTIAEHFAPQKLIAQLSQMGYNRVDSVMEKGDFSIIGDIVSVFPDSSELPVRISFFDEEIESIKLFDLESMKSTNVLDSVDICSRIDSTFSSVDLVKVLSEVKKSVKNYFDPAKSRAKEIISELESKIDIGNLKNLNWLLPFCDNLCGIEDILPTNTILL